jgi:hypothetical protein
MIKNRSERSVYDQCWYVETDICRDGPFTTRKEAARFVALLNTVSAAGIACSWITREGGPGVSRIPGARLTRKAGADST